MRVGIGVEQKRVGVRDQKAWSEDKDHCRPPHDPSGRQGRAPRGEGEKGVIPAGSGPVREREILQLRRAY